MDRVWIFLGGLAGLTSVAMAAAGAHGLVGRLAPAALTAVQSGVQMQGWHAIALVLCGIWARRGGGLVHLAAFCFLMGVLAFCGAVYGGAILDVHLPMVAPAGGTLLMAGWGVLALSAFTARRH